ncbi:terpenoid cyclase/Protein prenyltransferase [Phanerochaete sordida]|uniref:Terpenoid cyclase/Protein prenyltransferase n=1 Tax=Phanerochaete sordida TaxID=48140 RepID=A0A9P3LKF7_9APHY|nr:terpenoid cyclase/Protein prenyltransferase [Phanerochaete sordida]
MSELSPLPPLNRSGHVGHCKRFLNGLPAGAIESDASRVAIGFYCLGSLDLLGLLETKTKPEERESWAAWIWEQQIACKYGTGFKGSSYMTIDIHAPLPGEYAEYDTPNLIMTYTSILSLAILRDDLSKLDKRGLVQFIRSCQREDGSFSALPNGGEADLRCVYCAFAISSMLDDWSGIDLDRAVAYIRRCEDYEGGYGQQPAGEALGGTTYCALASLKLAPPSAVGQPPVEPKHRDRTIHWLLHCQSADGGFSGRTNKISDACYCFWCGASLAILGAGDLVDSAALAVFLSQCQFNFGGVAKAPDARPDPYHTYMALAATAVLPPPNADESWSLPKLDMLWNSTKETAMWLRKHVTEKA